ncbi:cardiolipin synthase (CMP-forming)-like [Oscarella lobularis]|uniref:cardiolipin synthase (CMP-forming)-like n=1 Tax=Oscarella lobularis TaxID=121494 RepID=UPI003313EFD0
MFRVLSVCSRAFLATGNRLQYRYLLFDSSKELSCCFRCALRRNSQSTTEAAKKRVEHIWTIPNFLSLSRIISTPIIGYLVIEQNYVIALGVFLVAGLTDLLDGYIARNFKNQKSMLGTVLDPFADKLLVNVLAMSLSYASLLPVPLTALFLIKDGGLVFSGFFVRYKSLTPPITLAKYWDIRHATTEIKPTLIGKVNTLFQLGLVASSLAAPVFEFVNHPILQGMWYLTAATTVGSGISYIVSKNAITYLQHSESERREQ